MLAIYKTVRLFVVGLTLLVAGCGSPDVFRKPVSDFAAATDKAAIAFTELDNRAAVSSGKIREDLAINRGVILLQGCATGDRSCVPVVNKSTDPMVKNLVALHPAAVAPKSVLFMMAMRNYGQALQDVVQADATANVKSALNNIAATASTVTTAFSLPAGGSLAILTKPLTSAGGWAFGQYQNEIKLEALQRATTAVDPIIQQAMAKLSEEAIFLEISSLADLRKKLEANREAFEAKPNTERLKAVVDAAGAMEAALKMKDTPLFKKLAEAHHALTLALQNPKSDPIEALTATDDFLNVATTVHDGLDALEQN